MNTYKKLKQKKKHLSQFLRELPPRAGLKTTRSPSQSYHIHCLKVISADVFLSKVHCFIPRRAVVLHSQSLKYCSVVYCCYRL